MSPGASEPEARRVMEICNACRYCEGFCAVFQAMELRRRFPAGDLAYLANLCHGCRACYFACQYAPPHPFGVNVPKTFAELRQQTYQAHAWPRPLASLFRRNGMVVAVVTAASLAMVLLLTLRLQPAGVLRSAHAGPGGFYAVIPRGALVLSAGLAGLFSGLAMVIAGVRFWRAAGGSGGGRAAALRDMVSLRYLGGAGHGCNDRDDRFSQTRRRLHHAMFYGFLLCFAATCLAAVYADVLGSEAPYRFLSLPVLSGTAGGLLLTVGTGGMLGLRRLADPAPTAPALAGSDLGLLLVLLLGALSGLLLLAGRGTAAMPSLLAIHVGIVLALLVLLPYSKFVHALYRALALLRWAREREALAAAASPPSRRSQDAEG
jgi:citrate/tricarballylate utilization protein